MPIIYFFVDILESLCSDLEENSLWTLYILGNEQFIHLEENLIWQNLIERGAINNFLIELTFKVIPNPAHILDVVDFVTPHFTAIYQISKRLDQTPKLDMRLL